MIDNVESVIVVLIDLSAAFDTIAFISFVYAMDSVDRSQVFYLHRLFD